jgi:hypothetical protein
MDEPQNAQPEPYRETPRERRIANMVLLVLLLIVVGGGIWLANAMFEQRRIDDCVAQGRRNCMQIDAPAR